MLKILIDPGHGGLETGAVANGFTEKDLNLELALLVRPALERAGFAVEMTRDTDIAMSLYDRGVMAKSKGCNSIVSIHFNSNDGVASGPEIIYSFTPEAATSSKWIAECILNETFKLTRVKRTVYTKESLTAPGHNYFGVLRNSEPLPGVICEGLFLDNTSDIELLKLPNFMSNLAEAYAKGICIAYGVTYIVPSKTVPKPVYPFKDWDLVSGYAKDPIARLKSLDLMSGDTKGNFNPKAALTREDFAVVINKLIDMKR